MWMQPLPEMTVEPPKARLAGVGGEVVAMSLAVVVVRGDGGAGRGWLTVARVAAAATVGENLVGKVGWGV